MRNKTRN